MKIVHNSLREVIVEDAHKDLSSCRMVNAGKSTLTVNNTINNQEDALIATEVLLYKMEIVLNLSMMFQLLTLIVLNSKITSALNVLNSSILVMMVAALQLTLFAMATTLQLEHVLPVSKASSSKEQDASKTKTVNYQTPTALHGLAEYVPNVPFVPS